MITQAEVKRLFDYRDGQLFWKVRQNRAAKGMLAGTLHKRGYRYIGVNGKRYQAHRLIFLWHHGSLPKELDHIDCDPTNNRIENLRACTSSQNRFNTKTPCDNTSGIKGVCWYKPYRKWMARINFNRKQAFLGYFDNLDEAATVVAKARKKYHGTFARVG